MTDEEYMRSIPRSIPDASSDSTSQDVVKVTVDGVIVTDPVMAYDIDGGTVTVYTTEYLPFNGALGNAIRTLKGEVVVTFQRMIPQPAKKGSVVTIGRNGSSIDRLGRLDWSAPLTNSPWPGQR